MKNNELACIKVKLTITLYQAFWVLSPISLYTLGMQQGNFEDRDPIHKIGYNKNFLMKIRSLNTHLQSDKWKK